MRVSSGIFELNARMEGFCYTEMETNETSSHMVVTAMKPLNSIMEQCVWLVLVIRVVVFLHCRESSDGNRGKNILRSDCFPLFFHRPQRFTQSFNKVFFK